MGVGLFNSDIASIIYFFVKTVEGGIFMNNIQKHHVSIHIDFELAFSGLTILLA